MYMRPTVGNYRYDSSRCRMGHTCRHDVTLGVLPLVLLFTLGLTLVLTLAFLLLLLPLVLTSLLPLVLPMVLPLVLLSVLSLVLPFWSYLTLWFYPFGLNLAFTLVLPLCLSPLLLPIASRRG